MPGVVHSPDDVTGRKVSNPTSKPSRDLARLDEVRHPNHRLPVGLSSFIGREREIEQVKRFLSESRLVTLTGTGGCGKTRLAIKVASELSEWFEEGVWWVELAALTDETLVSQAIAQALDVREVPKQALSETLANFLRAKQSLLMIDSCEHLITASALLAEQLLRACPNLKILATSREPLAIGGEMVYQVPILSLPEPKVSSPMQLMHSEAVRLFVERAHAVKPDFALVEQNARGVAQICQRLDGIPLAIELAAARVKLLTVEHIAARLDDRFSLLTTGSRTALPRHQTLRAAIDWSYDLLPEEARVLFRRLSVFAGGFTLNAAERVCSDRPLTARGVLDLLARLVDRSLVIVDEQHEEERYRMLETIRDYDHSKLQESGESERVQNRQLEFFLQLAEEAEPKLEGADQIIWLNRLESEHDNIRAALGWALESQVEAAPQARAKLGVRLAGALGWFWIKHGHWNEGSKWFRHALARKEASLTSRAKALLRAGQVAIFQSDYEQAVAFYEQSLTLYRGQYDRGGIANALFWLGWVAEDLGDFTRAAALVEESLKLQREVEDRHGIAFALSLLGELAYCQGDNSQGTLFLDESLTLSRELGDKWLVGGSLKWLSFVALNQGNYDRAESLASESLSIYRELGDKRQVGGSLYAVALAIHSRGDYATARTLLTEALSFLHEVNEKTYTARCLEAIAGIDVAEGEFERAARLFGAAEALTQTIKLAVLLQRSEYERNVTAVRIRMDQATFAKAWAEGRAMTLEQAIEYALETSAPSEALAHPAHPLTPRQAAKQEFGGLTGREREVALLVALGESNREIAAKLVISERTVESHVGNILNKLGLDTRGQIRKWVNEKGSIGDN